MLFDFIFGTFRGISTPIIKNVFYCNLYNIYLLLLCCIAYSTDVNPYFSYLNRLVGWFIETAINSPFKNY